MKLPYTDRQGEKAGNCKTTEKEIRWLCYLLEIKPTVSATKIAKECGLSPHIAASVVKGKCWRHISCDYDFSKRDEFNAKWGTKRQKIRLKKKRRNADKIKEILEMATLTICSKKTNTNPLKEKHNGIVKSRPR